MHIDWFLTDFKYTVQGSSAFTWDCFNPQRVLLMDFNNVSVAFNTDTKEVYALFIAPPNAPDSTYVWVTERFEVAFKREAASMGSDPIYLHSVSVAHNWAKQSWKDRDVDLTEDEYMELSLSSEQLNAIEALLEKGMTIEQFFQEALDDHANPSVDTP